MTEAMQPDELRRIGKALWGRGWQTRMAEGLGIDGSSLRRWIGGEAPTRIPSWAEAYVAMMQERQATRGALVYARQRIGSPLPTVDMGTPDYIESIRRLLSAPGVKDPKRMPGILAVDREGAVGIALTGGDADDIAVKAVSLAMTRHPDPWHLEGYLSCARIAGHEAVVTRHVDHYYSLVAHSLGTEVELLHQLSTHRGELRTVRSDPADPARVIAEDLSDILPPQHPPHLPLPADGPKA